MSDAAPDYLTEALTLNCKHQQFYRAKIGNGIRQFSALADRIQNHQFRPRILPYRPHIIPVHTIDTREMERLTYAARLVQLLDEERELLDKLQQLQTTDTINQENAT